MHALQLAGYGASAGAHRGIEYMRARQRDGSWDEPGYTGTGFPRDFYINYHLYRHVFPLLTLAGAEQSGGTTDLVGEQRHMEAVH